MTRGDDRFTGVDRDNGGVRVQEPLVQVVSKLRMTNGNDRNVIDIGDADLIREPIDKAKARLRLRRDGRNGLRNEGTNRGIVHKRPLDLLALARGKASKGGAMQRRIAMIFLRDESTKGMSLCEGDKPRSSTICHPPKEMRDGEKTSKGLDATSGRGAKGTSNP